VTNFEPRGAAIPLYYPSQSLASVIWYPNSYNATSCFPAFALEAMELIFKCFRYDYFGWVAVGILTVIPFLDIPQQKIIVNTP